jgi:hypothetical protein
MRQYSRDGGINGGSEYSNGTLWFDLTSTSSLFNRITDDRGFYSIDGLYSGRSYWILAYPARPPRNSTGIVSDVPVDPQARRQSIMPAYHPAARFSDAAVPVVLKAAERRDNVDIRISRAPSYCLEATITAAGIPPPLQVAVVEEELFRLDDYSSRQATLGPDGKIRVCDLYPGEFRLLVMREGTLIGIWPITVTNADVLGVILNAAAPPGLSGEIAWDVGNAQMVQDVRVRVGITPFS